MGRSKKAALITGSGRPRVGFEIAKHLAGIGYDIAVHYHSSEEEAADSVRKIESLGARAEKFRADVSDEGDVDSLIKSVTEEFGSIDVLVTTSSIWKTIPLEKVTADDVLASFRVNTLGTFLCCQKAGQVMVKQEEGGAIITIGDSLIAHPYKDHAAYFTAKGSIPTLTKAFAVELGNRNPNVRVNCIEPGPVMFPDDLPEEGQKRHIESTLTKQVDRPELVGQTVEFLINNAMLTGCCIPLDSGRNVAHEHYARAVQP